jgi:hypothetical protein
MKLMAVLSATLAFFEEILMILSNGVQKKEIILVY